MYVNELTLDLGEVGRRALETLYRRAVDAGLIAASPAIDVV
jgi:predicted solute-binding protein